MKYDMFEDEKFDLIKKPSMLEEAVDEEKPLFKPEQAIELYNPISRPLYMACDDDDCDCGDDCDCTEDDDCGCGQEKDEPKKGGCGGCGGGCHED